MVAVNGLDDLLRRADKAGDLPDRNPVLQQPGDAGVLERVRRDLIAKTGELAGAIPSLALLGDQSAGIFDRAGPPSFGASASGAARACQGSEREPVACWCRSRLRRGDT